MKKLIVSFGIVLLVLLVVAGYALAVTHGKPDGNGHPYVGLIVFDADVGGGVIGPAWRCTGTLIASNLVLTAGHCTDGAVAARVWFDTDLTSNQEYPYGGVTSYEGVPHTHPKFCLGCGPGLPGFDSYDVGVVVLSEPVTQAEYGLLPDVGLVDTLAMNTTVDLVGYGVQWQERGSGAPEWRGDLVRMFAPSSLNNSNFEWSDMYIRLSANSSQDKGGICFGDSGGADFLGDTRTILAVNSYVTNSNCAGVTYSNRIDRADVLSFINSFKLYHLYLPISIPCSDPAVIIPGVPTCPDGLVP